MGETPKNGQLSWSKVKEKSLPVSLDSTIAKRKDLTPLKRFTSVENVETPASPAVGVKVADTNSKLLLAQDELDALRLELEATKEALVKAKNQLSLYQNSEAAENTPNIKSYAAQELELDLLGKEALEKHIAPNSVVEDTIHFYLQGIERISEGMHCACLRRQANQKMGVSAPSLPKEFCQVLQSSLVNAKAGPFGESVLSGQKVVVADIEKDPGLEEFGTVLLSHGLKASWSFPVVGASQELLGSLSVFFKTPKSASAEDEAFLQKAVHLLQLILESQLSEQQLKESNERYHYTSLATNDALYDWAIQADHLTWGSGFEKIFGENPDENSSSVKYWESRIHPEDQNAVVTSLNKFIYHSKEENWQAEYRIVRADGSVGLISERGYIVRNELGVATRMVGALQDISTRRLAEEELRNLSVIAQETLNGVIIMNPDLTVKWVNPAFTNILGYTLADVEGKIPGSFLNGPETDTATLRYIDDQLCTFRTLQCEVVQYAKSGRKRWVRMQIQPLLDNTGQIESFFAFFTDITRQKKEERKLRLLESVMMNANDVICISKVSQETPSQLKNIFCNKAFSNLTASTADQILGRRPIQVSGPDQDPALGKTLQEAMKKEQAANVEVMGYRTFGDKFWGLVTLIPIFDDQNRLSHWITMMRDISNRKKYEQEREHLISELTQNNSDLKQFSFITSHNLRGPLSNLRGIVNLIDVESMEEGKNKMLIQKTKESALQLNNVIDDLLEILVIKNNVLKKESISLADAFGKVKLSVQELLDETGATVTTDFSRVPEVDFNAGYLHSILLNLLTNSIRYKSPDRPLAITVRTGIEEGRTVLQFSDNGLGIDLNRYRDRIFGLYQRFHQHKDSKGMGLYIAHSQAKAMGADLTVDSQVDQGTTFTLHFEK